MAFALLAVWLPDAQHHAFLMENGPVETASSLLYLLGAGLLQEHLFLSLEEIFELGMALALLLAVHGWCRRS
ncbi:hypothetical protein EGI20_13915 [Aquitalea sp. S1-19]|nr:hypothetical protein [Aquitalea sp. S1-19]